MKKGMREKKINKAKCGPTSVDHGAWNRNIDLWITMQTQKLTVQDKQRGRKLQPTSGRDYN